MIKEYVPQGYSQTNDSFAAAIVWAPAFPHSHRTPKEEFAALLAGLDSVIHRAKLAEAVELLNRCKTEVEAAGDMFLANVSGDKDKTRAARKKLQRAYYDLFKKAGELLAPGRTLGPDDDV